MSLIYTQGFEGFPVAGNRTALDMNFNYHNTYASSQAGLTTGRNGNGIAAFAANSQLGIPSGHLIPVAGLSSDSTWIVGFAWRSTFPWFRVSGSAKSPLVTFVDADGGIMLTVYLASGTISVRRGGLSSTYLGFANALLTTQVWHYFEIKVNFHASTGSIVIRANEEEVLSLTGINSSGTSATRPALLGVCGGQSARLETDDLYICDGTGGVQDDFLGDVRIERLSPTGVGNSSQFDTSAVADNYTLVDDTDPDGDTTYVESRDVGDKDTYEFGNSSASPAALEAVSVKSWVRKSDAGSRNFVHVARSSSSEADSAVLYPASTYRFMESIFTEDPATSAAWTIGGVNAAEFGLKVNA